MGGAGIVSAKKVIPASFFESRLYRPMTFLRCELTCRSTGSCWDDGNYAPLCAPSLHALAQDKYVAWETPIGPSRFFPVKNVHIFGSDQEQFLASTLTSST